MQSLGKIKEELTMGQEKLRSNLDMIDRQLSELQTVCSSLADEQGRLEKTLHSLESAGEEVDQFVWPKKSSVITFTKTKERYSKYYSSYSKLTIDNHVHKCLVDFKQTY